MQFEKSSKNLPLSDSFPSTDPVSFQKQSNFYAELSSDPSDTYSFYQIHDLIKDITNTIKTFLIDNFLFFPVSIKINLIIDGFRGDDPRKEKIKMPRKKCFKIWDMEMLEKGLLKIHMQLLEFHSCIKNPYELTINKIEGFKIKLRNMLTFTNVGQIYLSKFIEDFQKEIEEKITGKKTKNYVNKGEIARINNIMKTSKSSKNLLIFLIEKEEESIIENLENSLENPIKYTCIGPLQVFPNDPSLENPETEILFFHNRTRKFLTNQELKESSLDNYIETMTSNEDVKDAPLKIIDYICVYCYRCLKFEENFEMHYKACKLRKMKDTREKKMKDDLINDVEIFKRMTPQFSCKHNHIKCYKSIRKPRTQYIKNERTAKKLIDRKEDSDKDNMSLSTTTISMEKSNNIPFNTSKYQKNLNNYFPISKWIDEPNKETILRRLSIYPKTQGSNTLKNHIFKRFMKDVVLKMTPRSNEKKTREINKIYDDFIHDSPFFSFRNETFMRSKFENPTDFLCEFQAKELLKQCGQFETMDLQSAFTFHQRNLEDFEKGIDKVIELKKRIEDVAIKQKELKFTHRYTFKLMKYQKGLKDENPYGFRGLIKCDLEYKKDQNFLKKKFPVLPVNSWLEFRNPDDNNIRSAYKMKKNVFDDLNGYTILSDLLFYLLENDIMEIKRIEGFVSFPKTSNVLYLDFFKPIHNETINFVDKKDRIDYDLKEQIAENYTKEAESVFLENLFHKDTEKLMEVQEIECFSQNFAQNKRIIDFKADSHEVSKPKSMEMKVFKIMAFVYMSYLNLMNIDAILKYLINPQNINNIVLSSSEKMLNGKTNEFFRRIVIQKFSLVHLSFERVIIKYTCDTSETKKKKIRSLITLSEENPLKTYVFSHIINEFYFMRPYFFYRNYREDETLKSVKEEFLDFNREGFAEALSKETTPMNHCKYSILNLPFKLFKDCLYFNKLIFDDGHTSKNDKTVELMLHNLENRFRSENPGFIITFKQIFNRNRKEFKEDIFKMLDFGYNLDGYGVKWNLDHVIPINALKENPSLLYNVWNYTNIKPMKIVENMSKGCLYIEESNKSEGSLAVSVNKGVIYLEESTMGSLKTLNQSKETNYGNESILKEKELIDKKNYESEEEKSKMNQDERKDAL